MSSAVIPDASSHAPSGAVRRRAHWWCRQTHADRLVIGAIHARVRRARLRSPRPPATRSRRSPTRRDPGNDPRRRAGATPGRDTRGTCRRAAGCAPRSRTQLRFGGGADGCAVVGMYRTEPPGPARILDRTAGQLRPGVVAPAARPVCIEHEQEHGCALARSWREPGMTPKPPASSPRQPPTRRLLPETPAGRRGLQPGAEQQPIPVVGPAGPRRSRRRRPGRDSSRPPIPPSPLADACAPVCCTSITTVRPSTHASTATAPAVSPPCARTAVAKSSEPTRTRSNRGPGSGRMAPSQSPEFSAGAGGGSATCREGERGIPESRDRKGDDLQCAYRCNPGANVGASLPAFRYPLVAGPQPVSRSG